MREHHDDQMDVTIREITAVRRPPMIRDQVTIREIRTITNDQRDHKNHGAMTIRESQTIRKVISIRKITTIRLI
jgi:hypothetical protein